MTLKENYLYLTVFGKSRDAVIIFFIMNDIDSVVGVLRKLKNAGNLSIEDQNDIDQAIALLQKKKRSSILSGLVIGAKYLLDFFLEDDS